MERICLLDRPQRRRSRSRFGFPPPKNILNASGLERQQGNGRSHHHSLQSVYDFGQGNASVGSSSTITTPGRFTQIPFGGLWFRPAGCLATDWGQNRQPQRRVVWRRLTTYFRIINKRAKDDRPTDDLLATIISHPICGPFALCCFPSVVTPVPQHVHTWLQSWHRLN